MSLTLEPPVRAVSRPSAPLVDTAQAADLLQAWLDTPAKPEVLRLDDGRSVPLAWVLGALSHSRTPLTAGAAATVGLAPGATMGEAAVALVLAVNDPRGPHCRSYRAAAYYLHDLAGIQAALDGLDEVAAG